MSTELYLVIGVVVIALVFLLCSTYGTSNGTEQFAQILGALGPYAKPFNECINQCNKEDSSKFLSPWMNANCGRYCESIFTQMAQKGIPPESLKIKNSFTDCEEQCSGWPGSDDSNAKWKCISVCYGQQELAKWCKERQCPYSDMDHDACMDTCIYTNTANNDQVSWTFGLK